eukprot:CAMPEP_0181502714 /NCGR_PEP_ID=MMETSP1110-20121109/56524_1 /TAXON_ID=174948 /ORGANISM="Symbiodinium sp., Strain CCMP421" /LENGTH=39 /DNA_ID= /DNA_START= /DNA_END= /DNA_ORIENTATION=
MPSGPHRDFSAARPRNNPPPLALRLLHAALPAQLSTAAA